MTKLEEVIDALSGALVNMHGFSRYTPEDVDELEKAGLDALELLKEREAEEQCLKTKCIICPHCDNCDVDENGLPKAQVAVKPKEVNMYPTGQYACGFCGHISVGSKDYHAKYCPECGKAVKWE